jgi:hypothetical protein
LAVATADGVATADAISAVAVVAAAASELVLIWGVDAAVAVEAGALAAIAAAAIASGAVALPDAGAAVGTPADVMATGIATATALGVVADAPPCSAETAESVEDPAVELLLEDGFSADFAGSAFWALDFVLGRGAALALVSAAVAALASEACLAPASRLSELSFAVWSADAASRDRAASAVAAASSALRCDEDGGWAVEVARWLPVSTGMLLSTSAPKPSLPCDWSDRAGFAGAVEKIALVAASDVTPYTGGLSQ